jgi:hypothetical protein
MKRKRQRGKRKDRWSDRQKAGDRGHRQNQEAEVDQQRKGKTH